MQLTEVEVMRLGLDRSNNFYVVILKEKEGERLLPIWIGQPEAESIVIEMSKLRRDLPLTHDLCKTLITGLGGTLRRIHITKVENRSSDDGDVLQRVEMVFKTVQIDYRAQGRSGRAGPMTFAWDIPAGTASPWA